MTSEEPDAGPASKRLKLTHEPSEQRAPQSYELDEDDSAVLNAVRVRGLGRPISPPLVRRTAVGGSGVQQETAPERQRYIPSPIRLTTIRDLGAEANADAVSLRDLLGDALVRECWNFNYLFDVDFVMSALDPDVRELVEVRIVHGFWRREDERRVRLQKDSERYPNVKLINAYIPDPFGTHHSKMLILIRHDDTAQVIIHTANMIPRDWGNMTQAVWRSPLLPLLSSPPRPLGSQADRRPPSCPIGSGARFKTDLLRYLSAYDTSQLSPLKKQLINYDFSAVRAAFIASAPSRDSRDMAEPEVHTSWGWRGLREILSTIPVSKPPSKSTLPETEKPSQPHIVVQISSIATLGATPTWLQNFQSVLSCNTVSAAQEPPSQKQPPSSFFTKRPSLPTTPKVHPPHAPKFSIIFPTATEIRASLDGYASGASIHTKLQSAAQQAQLKYLHPMLCHWNALASPSTEAKGDSRGKGERASKALRGPAAPHIKTYVRFADEAMSRVHWVMVTSANLSKQAWGDMENARKQVWIQSWEVGVVVWPDLFQEAGEEAVMVPVFGKDRPAAEDARRDNADAGEVKAEGAKKRRAVVGFRMPYDLPLVPYAADEVPWCATMAHTEPDRKGQIWRG